MLYQIIVLIVLFSKIESISSQDTFEPYQDSICRPGCSNKIKRECNIFKIELRASMVKCETNVGSKYGSSTVRSKKSSKIHKRKPINLDCDMKIAANLEITNQGRTSTYNQYVIIDHVIDSSSGQKVGLLNPYIVVLRQTPLLQLYNLKYKNMVNSEAKEQVMNKKNPNFKGCQDGYVNPTCGSLKFNGNFIPYSQGFCCSCDDRKNVKRQPRSTSQNLNSSFNFQNFIQDVISNCDSIVRKKRSLMFMDKGEYDFNDYRTKYHYNVLKNLHPNQDYEDLSREEPDDLFLNPSEEDYIINKEYPYHKIQIRGGQDCDDWNPQIRTVPSSSDSAHCLRFSRSWYAVYEMCHPVLQHMLYLRIFQKRDKEDGCISWVDLTAGKTITLGTTNPIYRDVAKSLLITYNTEKNTCKFAIDARRKRLLIPQKSQKVLDIERYLEAEGGAPEYLIVDDSVIDPTGQTCDTAGVGYYAFYNQPERCNRRRGSCLRNQPKQLWNHDKMLCKRGKKGAYFLKHYAQVPEDAVRTAGNKKYLALQYNERHKSSVNFEIKADDNIMFKSISQAKITEVYVESTVGTSTIFTIKIHNNGLMSNSFRPRLTDCPSELPVDWGNLEGESVVIPPQHHTIFTLQLLGKLTIKKFCCSIEALNSKNEVVAVRRILIVRGDRCICSWHCLCACLKKTKLGCTLMTMEHYKAAGFVGSMPLSTNMVQKSRMEHVIFGCCFFIALFTIILLLMGLTKGIIGICFFVPVGIWGLDMIIGVRSISNYFERSLKGREVVFDDECWPVHPDTKKRCVRIVDVRLEFCLNLIFFFTYPVMLLLFVISKWCCPFYSYTGEEDNNLLFDGVNAVVYTKCPDSRQCSESGESLQQFEFESIASS